MTTESLTLSPSVSPTFPVDAVTRAGEFLLAKQDPEGTWCDFREKPGVSDAWTTAFVGSSLLALPESLRPAGTEAAVARAATWLMKKMNRFHGWGYNSVCPTDSDSCANVVLFLAQADWDFPPHTYARLLSFQREDGGFRTYYRQDPNDSWTHSHPCVTPVVARALLAVKPPSDPKMARAFDAILAAQRADGLWHSFWWETPLYSTMVNIEACLLAGVDFPREQLITTLEQQRPSKVFDLALLLRCLALLDRPMPSGAADLLARQNSDGSWPVAPILLFTTHESYEPWKDEDPGPLVPDHNRLFTTAMAIRALVTHHAALTESLDNVSSHV